MASAGDECDWCVQMSGQFFGAGEFDVGIVVAVEDFKMGTVGQDCGPVEFVLGEGFHAFVEGVAEDSKNGSY